MRFLYSLPSQTFGSGGIGSSAMGTDKAENAADMAMSLIIMVLVPFGVGPYKIGRI